MIAEHKSNFDLGLKRYFFNPDFLSFWLETIYANNNDKVNSLQLGPKVRSSQDLIVYSFNSAFCPQDIPGDGKTCLKILKMLLADRV